LRGLVWFCLLVAGVATGVLGVLVLKDRTQPPPEAGPPPAAAPGPPTPPPAAEAKLRAYETTGTLVEDLRDALAGPPEALGAEVCRVSDRLKERARSVLVGVAPEEASPKVRALLVLAAGRHVPDEPILLAFLRDREAVVRRAATLAAAQADEGTPFPLLTGVDVPVGRALPPATRLALEERLRLEEDEGVRGALAAVLRG